MVKGEEKKASTKVEPAAKTKVIKKAKNTAKKSKKGQTLKRQHKIRTNTRFYRPKTH